jgi:leader peptidase (prepilin peptidase) / N-methyltransferase
MTDLEAVEDVEAEDDLRPNPAVLLVGAAAIALVSVLYLPWPVAIASTVLGALMIAGADIDARTFLLPDLITGSAVVCGIMAAPLMDVAEPWTSCGDAIARAAGIAVVLASFRSFYGWFRQREGLGLGDVKLAAGIGAWLPIDAIPSCFGLATTSALITVMLARLRGQSMLQTTRIPFGAFLCPALWIVFFAERVLQ